MGGFRSGQRPAAMTMTSRSWESGTNWACAIVTAVIGVCCICGGIYMFAAATDNQRQTLVHDYDATVQYWKAKGLDQFKGVTCTVANLTGSGSYSLVEDNSAENMRDSSQSQLSPYTPLSYVHTGNIAPNLQWNSAGTWAADVTMACKGGAATTASTFVAKNLALFETRVFELSNQKQCMYQRKGSYRNGR